MKRFFALFLLISLLLSLFASCAEVPAEDGTVSQPAVSDPVPEEPPLPFDLRITEVMADNRNLCLGHDLDWGELCSREETSVLLDGYYLTDDPEEPEKLSLAGLRVEAEGYLTVVLPDSAPFHLSAQGETVYLTYEGEVLSLLAFAATEQGESHTAEGPACVPRPDMQTRRRGIWRILPPGPCRRW